MRRRHFKRLHRIRIRLIRKRVHDDVIGDDAQRVDLLHEHVGRDHVEVNVLEEAAENFRQIAVGRIAIFLTPHQSRREFRELIGLELLPGQDEPDHVLRQEREAAQVQNLVAVLVHELQDLDFFMGSRDGRWSRCRSAQLTVCVD